MIAFSSSHYCVEGFGYATQCEVPGRSVLHLNNTFQMFKHVGRVHSTKVFESAMAFLLFFPCSGEVRSWLLQMFEVMYMHRRALLVPSVNDLLLQRIRTWFKE